tara:strand:- start:581 stop:805 length:225 start_codon:yes stop_codon:yes gene_type:complete
MSKKYNPNNPAFDACLSTEAIINRMKPQQKEPKSTKGMLSKRTPTVRDSMKDGRERIAKYVKALRDIREDKQNG